MNYEVHLQNLTLFLLDNAIQNMVSCYACSKMPTTLTVLENLHIHGAVLKSKNNKDKSIKKISLLRALEKSNENSAGGIPNFSQKCEVRKFSSATAFRDCMRVLLDS